MAIQDFLAHATDPAPGFRCYDCRDDTESPVFIARVSNQLNSPACPEDLEMIDRLLGRGGQQLRRLYERHNGLLLYKDFLSDNAGIEFYPVREWEELSTTMREDLAMAGFDDEEFPMSDWAQIGVVFAGVQHTSNRFVVQPVGKNIGRIYYAPESAYERTAIARDLNDLLQRVCANPAQFLYDLGCYTGYSDGKTEIQWVPREYVANVRGQTGETERGDTAQG